MRQPESLSASKGRLPQSRGRTREGKGPLYLICLLQLQQPRTTNPGEGNEEEDGRRLREREGRRPPRRHPDAALTGERDGGDWALLELTFPILRQVNPTTRPKRSAVRASVNVQQPKGDRPTLHRACGATVAQAEDAGSVVRSEGPTDQESSWRIRPVGAFEIGVCWWRLACPCGLIEVRVANEGTMPT